VAKQAPKQAHQPVRQPLSRKERLRRLLIRTFPAWVILCGVLALGAPNVRNFVEHLIAVGGYIDESERAVTGNIAPLFTPEVDHWQADIFRWARASSVDPNLLATVIQIESCGDPNAVSSAGALGLMQVMPFHFAEGENPLDPETNVARGVGVLTECLFSAYNPQIDVGLALACYNGGPSVFVNAMADWHPQAQGYYRWGSGIYRDAAAGLASSATLDAWLRAGGDALCAAARRSLGLTEAPSGD